MVLSESSGKNVTGYVIRFLTDGGEYTFDLDAMLEAETAEFVPCDGEATARKKRTDVLSLHRQKVSVFLDRTTHVMQGWYDGEVTDVRVELSRGIAHRIRVALPLVGSPSVIRLTSLAHQHSGSVHLKRTMNINPL